MRQIAVVGMRGLDGVIGGIETHCAALYPDLAARLPEVRFTLLARRRYVAARRSDFAGMEVRGLWSPRHRSLETLIHSLVAVLHARFHLRADVVHLHGIGPGFFAPLARMLGMRVIVTSHAPDYRRPKWGLFGRTFLRLGESMAARSADRLICVSETVRRDLVARFPGAERCLTTIRHGVRLTPSPIADDAAHLAELGLSPSEYLLAVSRFDATKRLEDLIVAHRHAAEETLPLVIVGSGDEDPDYAEELRAMAGDRVIFAGFRNGAQLTALYRGAAALFHPSEMEGFGLVILEALSVGTPVLTSDIPVHREFALPETAYFALGDVPAIRVAREAIEVRAAPWPPAPAIVARHSHARSVEAHATLFRDVLDENRTVAGQPPGRVSNTSKVRQ